MMSGQLLYAPRTIIITHRYGASHRKSHSKADKNHNHLRQPWLSHEYDGAEEEGGYLTHAMGGCGLHIDPNAFKKQLSCYMY